MTDFTLEIESRTAIGARNVKRLRTQGLIPSSVYAKGDKALSCQLSTKDFTQLASKAKISTVFTLKSSTKELNGRLAIVKEIQRHSLDGKLLHVDLQTLKENEEIVVKVPLSVVGEAAGVKLDGGILTISAHDISLACLPKFIPDSIEVDVNALRLGNSVHALDLKLPANVRLAGNPNQAIVSVVAVRQIVEETPAAATAEATAEGAAATAEGATPAAGAEGAAKAAPAAEGAGAAKAAKSKEK